MKKFLSMCLSLMLALALAVPAYASGAEEAGVIGGDDGPTAIFVTSFRGDVDMQVNGQYVRFTGAEPEIVDGRTMVPMRGVLDALEATVDYDHASKTVKATLGEMSLTHTIGTDEITLSGGQVLTMDAASYLKDGNVMVPLRFFSQALGLEVYWDQGQRTAVVIDKQKVIGLIDNGFTILNDLQAKQKAALTDNTAIELGFDGAVKLLDSIGGDKEYPFSMEMTGLYGRSAINAEGSMDLSILSALMEAVGEDVPEEMAALLENLEFEMIYSSAGLWMQMPGLSGMLQEIGAEIPDGDVWFQMDSADMGGLFDLYAMAMAAENEAVTMGDMLYTMVEFMDAEVPVNIYDDVLEAAILLGGLVGDYTFLENGDGYTWELDQGMLDNLASNLGADSVTFPGTMEMTIRKDGSAEFSMEIAVDEEPLALVMSLSGASTAAESAIQGSIQVKNVCDVTFQGGAKVQPSETAPFSAPPADVVIVDLGGVPAPLVEVN